MRKICRFCLQLCQKTTVIPENAHQDRCNEISYLFLTTCIKDVIPEISLGTLRNARVCDSCIELIKSAYSFRRKCLESDRKIVKYMKANNVDYDKLILDDVIYDNNSKTSYEVKSKSQRTNNVSDLTEIIKQEKELELCVNGKTICEQGKCYENSFRETRFVPINKHKIFDITQIIENGKTAEICTYEKNKSTNPESKIQDVQINKRKAKEKPQQLSVIQIIDNLPEVEEIENDVPEYVQVCKRIKNDRNQVNGKHSVIMFNSNIHPPPFIQNVSDFPTLYPISKETLQTNKEKVPSNQLTIKPILVFPCKVCKQVLRTQEDLERHLQLHLSAHLLVNCKICGVLVLEKCIRKHLMEHKMSFCPYCNDIIKNEDYENHTRVHVAKLVTSEACKLWCRDCVGFVNVAEFEKHQEMHRRENEI